MTHGKYTTPLILAAPGTADAALADPQLKDVTRRLVGRRGTCAWRVGAISRLYRKSPRNGGQPIGEADIISVRRERLSDITEDEVRREGFPHLDVIRFLGLFIKLNGVEPGDHEVWRIEFRTRRSS